MRINQIPIFLAFVSFKHVGLHNIHQVGLGVCSGEVGIFDSLKYDVSLG